MNTTVQQPVAAARLFIWIGFVCSISFMEAWLKFRAPGVTIPIGVGIGRLVFGALNKVEWLFAVLVFVSVFVKSKSFFTISNVPLSVVVLILVLQTVLVLPALDAGAELFILNKPFPGSNLHSWFIGAELIKIIALFITAVSIFKHHKYGPGTDH